MHQRGNQETTRDREREFGGFVGSVPDERGIVWGWEAQGVGGTLASSGRCERRQRGLWDVREDKEGGQVGGNALSNVE